MALVLTGIASANAQIVWGVRAGLSRPTLTAKVEGDGENRSESLNGNFGIEAGPVMYYSFSNKLYLNPAVMFSIKSFGSDEDKISMYLAEVPVYLGYRIPIGKVETYLQAGPYAGFKIGESGKEDSGLKSFDAGLAVMYGVNIKRFKIEAGYKHGLTNLFEGSIGEIKWSERMSSIFLGINYIF